MISVDIPSMIVVVLLLVAFFLPLYYHQSKSKKKEKATLLALEAFVDEKNILLHKLDSWRGIYFIGLDTEKDLLVYFKALEGSLPMVLDLRSIRNCSIRRDAHEVKENRNAYQVMDRLELNFSFKMGDHKDVSLEFYDAERFSSMEGEVPLINKWQGIITAALGSMPAKIPGEPVK